MQGLYRYLKLFMAAALAVSLVSGCGSRSVSETYQLESVTQNGPQASRVYRAENKTVPQVAQELAEQRTPREISKEDPERMFLVYPDEWYHLQRDPQKPGDTLIEISSKEFIQQNYSPGFLEGYILAEILDELFDAHKHYSGNYRGYTSKDIYKPNIEYRKPTAQEKKQVPPITKQGSGSIIKRSDKPSAASEPTVGSGGSITKREPASPPKDTGTSSSAGGSGTIMKSSRSITGSSTSKSSSSSFSPPKNNSPPKTKVGSSGSITKRK
ncbi:DUF4247 domain-containing protein [Effusibacillus consociatus]|uniref:DUF4247 domain-containing protein n=1 Tax=Effusibacillus consociatus TaxID=1117041 RepID=A0ABV9PWR9_9BACL